MEFEPTTCACPTCNHQVDETELVAMPSGPKRCPNCPPLAPAHKCASCGCTEHLYRVDGDYYCGECSFYCDDCGTRYAGEHSGYNENENPICSRCADNYTSCSSCHRTVHPDNTYAVDDRYYCEGCYNNLPRCNECGEAFRGRGSLCQRCQSAELEIKNITFTTMPDRTFGVEIEACYAENRQHPAFACDHDGSVSGDGLEFRSKILRGDQGLAAVEDFCEKAEVEVDRSCGLHIHLGAKDMSWFDVAKLYAFCCKYEPEFMAMVAQSRRSNSYCRKLNKTDRPETLFAHKQALIKTYYQTDQTGKKAQPKDTPQRYHWLNLNGYFSHRVIEIRLHQGSGDEKKIKKWLLLWANIFEWAKKTAPSRILKAEPGIEGFAPILKEIVPEIAQYYINRIERR